MHQCLLFCVCHCIYVIWLVNRDGFVCECQHACVHRCVLHVLAFIQKHILHKIQMKHRMGTHLVFIKASFTQHDCHPKIIGCVKPWNHGTYAALAAPRCEHVTAYMHIFSLLVQCFLKKPARECQKIWPWTIFVKFENVGMHIIELWHRNM